MRLFDDVKKTQLGASVTIPPGREAAIIRAYGPDQLAQVVTVQMNVVDVDRISFASNPVYQLTGIVRWGIGGQQDSAEVDLINGAIVSVPASFVEVIARNESFRTTINTASQGFFNATVSASVGYGSRAPTGIPGAFRTVQYLEASGGAPNTGIGPGQISAPKPIPRWAGAAVIVFTPPTVTVTVRVQDSNGAPLYAVGASSGDSIPIVSPGYSLSIVNESSPPVPPLPPTANDIRARVQYALII
jgi:hypothetical protein